MARGAELVILFADVAGSTRLYEVLGDTRARVMVARSVGIMTEATRRHSGQLVKTIGDEVMTLFRTADHAAGAAVEMQDAITTNGISQEHKLAIRVGFHYGPVLIDRADVYGDAVNVASRVTEQAKPGQILATGAVRALMSDRWRAETRLIAQLDLKGKQGRTDVHEVIWQAEEMTMLQAPPRPAAAARPSLVLIVGDRKIELGDPRPVFTAGRDERNDVVLGDVIVSRHHARVEHRNGRFVLTDQSANGTFIVPDEGSTAFVHRDTVELAGKGLLGLGALPGPDSPVTIRYEHGGQEPAA